MKPQILLLLVLIWLVGCTPTAQATEAPISTIAPDSPVSSDPTVVPGQESPEDSLAPRPGDATLTRGNVFLQEARLLVMESYPLQIMVYLSGERPTPCHQLRAAVSEPDAQNRIDIDVYTVVDPDMMCTQVVVPFEESVSLGSFPTGHYSVYVNGQLAGEFDS